MFSEAEKGKLKTGFKEVMNIVARDKAQRVVIAEDCEDKIKLLILNALEEKGIEAEYAPTMKQLGKMCGIDVGASCATVTK